MNVDPRGLRFAAWLTTAVLVSLVFAVAGAAGVLAGQPLFGNNPARKREGVHA